jgi:Mg-chelatase subunit ChlD
MIKLGQKTIIITIICGIISSCSTAKKITPVVQAKETAVENDAPAPVGYKPDFITNVDLFRVDTSINYRTKVINTEVKNGKVRIYFNITDDHGKAYVRANQDKWDKVWCLAQEKSGEQILTVKNYQLFGSNERDTVANAFAFVLDHSGSMGDLRVLTVQNAISNLLTNGVKAEDAFAAIKYDNRVVLEVPLTKDPDVLMAQFKVNGIAEYGGMTAINDGLDKAIDVLDGGGNYTNKAAVIFTDGIDNSSKMSQSDVISKAKLKGIKIFAIDFGANIGGKNMKEIADQTGGCYYHIYKTNEFNSVFTDIYKRMKNVYVFEYMPSFFGQIQFKINLCNNNKKIELIDSINYEAKKGNYILGNINFDSNKSNVKNSSSQEIERIAGIMKKETKLKFQIQCHTDDVGDAKINQILSQKRAEAVKNELVKKGIDKSRLIAKGFGESVPIADNKTKEGKSMNRRTEFLIME